MAKRQPNKRIQKKITRQGQRANLSGAGYSEKDIKNLKGAELEKASAKVDQKRKYNQNRKYLEELGIDKRIISQKQIYRRSDKFLRDRENIKKWLKETRELHRYDRLIEAGFKKSEIKKSWLRYDKITNRIIYERLQYKVFNSPYYLLLMYADVMGDSDIDPDKYENYNFSDLKEAIADRYDEAEVNPDDSGSFHGAFRIMISKDKNKLKLVSRQFEKRGYNIAIGKFSKSSYDTVTLKNDFSPREFAEMLLLIMEHSSNADAVEHYKLLQKYALTFNHIIFNEIFHTQID